MILVDKNIPIPPHATGPRDGERWRYPFNDMGVGDSFLIPATCACSSPVGPPCEHVAGRRRFVLQVADDWKPALFIARRVDGGIRVWRVS
jgi:hypothetical protein